MKSAIRIGALALLLAASAANAQFFSVNTAYGSAGLGTAVPANTFATGANYPVATAIDASVVGGGTYGMIAGVDPRVTTNSFYGPWGLVRYTASGVLDVNFGGAGMITTVSPTNIFTSGFATNIHLNGMCVDPLTHNVVVVGDAFPNGSPQQWFLARLVPQAIGATALLDTTFNPNGAVPGVVQQTMKATMTQGAHVKSCFVASDSSIYAVGFDQAVSGSSGALASAMLAVAKFAPNGALDTTFGTGGFSELTLTDSTNTAFVPDGTVVYGGAGNPDLILAGTTPTNQFAWVATMSLCTGALDSANFNGTGLLVNPAITGYSGYSWVGVAGDGRVLQSTSASGAAGDFTISFASSTPAQSLDEFVLNFPTSASAPATTPAHDFGAVTVGSIVLPNGASLGGGGGAVFDSAGHWTGFVRLSNGTSAMGQFTGDSSLGFTSSMATKCGASGSSSSSSSGGSSTSSSGSSSGSSTSSSGSSSGSSTSSSSSSGGSSTSSSSSSSSGGSSSGGTPVTLSSPGGAVTLSASAGTLGNASVVSTPSGAPTGVSAPLGWYVFNITGLTPGASANVTFTLPSNYTATGYEKCDAAGTCTQLPAGNVSIKGNQMTVTLVDGGVGDADGVANGTISDPGAPIATLNPAPAPAKGGGGGAADLLTIAALAAAWAGIRRARRRVV